MMIGPSRARDCLQVMFFLPTADFMILPEQGWVVAALHRAAATAATTTTTTWQGLFVGLCCAATAGKLLSWVGVVQL